MCGLPKSRVYTWCIRIVHIIGHRGFNFMWHLARGTVTGSSPSADRLPRLSRVDWVARARREMRRDGTVCFRSNYCLERRPVKSIAISAGGEEP